MAGVERRLHVSDNACPLRRVGAPSGIFCLNHPDWPPATLSLETDARTACAVWFTGLLWHSALAVMESGHLWRCPCLPARAIFSPGPAASGDKGWHPVYLSQLVDVTQNLYV